MSNKTNNNPSMDKWIKNYMRLFGVTRIVAMCAYIKRRRW